MLYYLLNIGNPIYSDTIPKFLRIMSIYDHINYHYLNILELISEVQIFCFFGYYNQFVTEKLLYLIIWISN